METFLSVDEVEELAEAVRAVDSLNRISLTLDVVVRDVNGEYVGRIGYDLNTERYVFYDNLEVLE